MTGRMSDRNMGTYREDIEYLRNTLREAPWPYGVMYAAAEEWRRFKTADGGEIAPDCYTPASIMGLLNSLTVREKMVLELRYRDHKTLEETGRTLGVTRERIRQIEFKAFRKMLHPYNLQKAACVPYMEYQREVRKREEAERRCAEAEQRLDWFLQHGDYKVNFTDTVSADNADDAIAKLKTPIEDLVLSVRSFNCLARANIRTVGDILKIENEDDMHSIRNLGRKSAEEIIGKVHALGLKMKWEV